MGFVVGVVTVAGFASSRFNVAVLAFCSPSVPADSSVVLPGDLDFPIFAVCETVCAIVAGGVKCWGAPSGLGGAAGTATPNAVDVLAAGSGIVEVGGGAKAACAVRFNCTGARWGVGLD